YAFGDIFSYALWPDYYYGPFWGFDTVGFYDALFWDLGPRYRAGRRLRGLAQDRSLLSQVTDPELCTGYAPGVIDLPIADFETAINPDQKQRQLLADLRTASTEAKAKLQQACPQQPAATPVARLDAIRKRLAAMREAIQIVADPLDRFYAALNDDQ